MKENEGDDRYLEAVGWQGQLLHIHECQSARVLLLGQAKHAR